MDKEISYKVIIGNALISTKKNHMTKQQIYKYWKIVDTLLPDGYYTYGNNNSFEDFCEEYSFLVKRINDKVIIDCNVAQLERYFRIGIPTEVIKVFDIAGATLNDIELQVSNDNNNDQNFTVLTASCNRAFVVAPEKAEAFKNHTNRKKDNEQIRKMAETFIRNNLQEVDKNVRISNLDDLINRIVENSTEFYCRIEELLSPEERVLIRNHLLNKSCMSCTNASCRVESHEKIGTDEFGQPQGSQCLGWNNPELIGRSKVLKIYDINKMR